MHKRALSFAANHFAISFVLGTFLLLEFYGAGLSDSYSVTPLWVSVLVGLLWILQFPTLLIFKLLLPKGNLLLLYLFGSLWSVLLGYFFACLFKGPKNGAEKRNC